MSTEADKTVSAFNMINRSPWLWGVRKTAAGLTGRTSLGIQILQGKRAPGQSNPSPEYTAAQETAALLWPLYRANQGMINLASWTLQPGWSKANAWYDQAFPIVFNGGVPIFSPSVIDNISMANGPISSTPFATTPVADESLGTIVWTMPTTVADSTQDNTDVLRVAIYNYSKGTWVYGQQSTRSTLGAISFTLPTGTVAGDVLVIWTTFIGGSGGLYFEQTSPSVAVNVTAVA